MHGKIPMVPLLADLHRVLFSPKEVHLVQLGKSAVLECFDIICEFIVQLQNVVH